MSINDASVSIHAPARGATWSCRPGSPHHASFNPRARAGRDFNDKQIQARLDEFQSTRPRGARRSGRATIARTVASFQSTRPRGARPVRYSPANGRTMFQSTRPRGARPMRREAVAGYAFWFQSTRPRGARLSSLLEARRLHLVSIHAPARGATWRSGIRFATGKVSIHAPARGATQRAVRRSIAACVSIHAPARGATRTRQRHWRCVAQFQSTRPRGARHSRAVQSSHTGDRFNPRARAGRDASMSWPTAHLIAFQSTRPRGARLCGATVSEPICLCFNPRARAGRDRRISSTRQREEAVSIHAPARGATCFPSPSVSQ